MARRLPVLSAFDPGTAGWDGATGTGSQLPRASAWRFPFTGERLGEMLDWVERALQNHIDAYRPDAFAYEAPILKPTDRLQPIRKTYNLGGMIEFVALRRGIECVEYSVYEVKEALAGFKGADKDDMVAAAMKLGVSLPVTAAEGRKDAADALGVWLCLLRSRSPVISSQYDAKLWGARASALI
jgi:Holliday junction resolvasome RuvABC endonuclease subunit